LRMLPFFKPKKGFMIAGGGLEASAGGGGGSGGVNFSTSEFPTHCKWIDGKDIFGTTLNVTVADTYTNIDIANIITNKDVVDITGMLTDGADKYPCNWYLDSSYNVATRVNTANKKLSIHKSLSEALTGDITIFYTKNS